MPKEKGVTALVKGKKLTTPEGMPSARLTQIFTDFFGC
jgi:hypothetical protein